MSDARQAAVERRREVGRELAEINFFLSSYSRFSGQISAKPLAPKKRGRPDEYADKMARIIQSRGKPLMRRELVAALEAEGVVIPSGDKQRYLGTILWRCGRFINRPGEGYALAADAK